MWKCPSSILCRDSSSRPLEHESPPITTRRGLKSSFAWQLSGSLLGFDEPRCGPKIKSYKDIIFYNIFRDKSDDQKWSFLSEQILCWTLLNSVTKLLDYLAISNWKVKNRQSRFKILPNTKCNFHNFQGIFFIVKQFIHFKNGTQNNTENKSLRTFNKC